MASVPTASPSWNKATIQELLTPQRLSSYLTAASNDLSKALKLYEWNTHADAALVQTVALVEVVIRNAIDRELIIWARSRHAAASWFDIAPLDSRGLKVLSEARRRATQAGHRAEDHGKVIAELSFGFWRVLVASKYHASLWVPSVHRSFPFGDANLRRRRTEVEALLRQIGSVRNRAAHHEPVHQRDLNVDLQRAVTATSWVSPDAGAWVADTSILPRIIAERSALGI